MTLILKLFNELKSFFFSYEFKAYYSKNIPPDVEIRSIYIIGEKEFKWLILFKCPCGCKERINLNLLKEDYPKWTYSIKKKKISISPSIRRIKGCKSHFWIKSGRIIWC